MAGKALGSDIPPGQRRNFMQHPCTACRNHKLPPALKKHQKILSGRLTFICLMYPKFHSLSYYVNGFCPIHMPPYSNLFFSLNSTQFFQFSELVLKGNFTLHTGMKKIVSFDLGNRLPKIISRSWHFPTGPSRDFIIHLNTCDLSRLYLLITGDIQNEIY